MDKQVSSSVTLKDIADATGFSLVSVHRAMNGKSGVSENTRRKILSAARDMGYTANLMASVLKRKTVNIAIVIPECERAGAFYFNYMWKGCRDYINDISGYQINFIEFPFELHPGAQLEEQDQLEALDKLYAEHSEELNGLLTVPMLNTAALRESLERFIQHDIAVVLIDNDFPTSGRLCCIAPNDENTGRLSAELMCSMVHQTSGSILVAAGNETSFSHQLNAMGFADYVRTHRPELNVITVNDQNSGPCADRFFEYLRDPNVIAAYSVRARNTMPLCNAALRLESQRKLLLLGSDLFDQSADMLRRGVLKGIVYKNPYQKGFLGLKVLVEHLLMDKPPKSDRLFVQISIIMRNNLVFFEDFI